MYLLQIVWGASPVVSCESLVDHTGGQVLNLFEQKNQQYLWEGFFLRQGLIPSPSQVGDEETTGDAPHTIRNRYI